MRARRGLLLAALTLTVALAVAPPLAALPLHPRVDPFSLTAINRVSVWLSRLTAWFGRDGLGSPPPRPTEGNCLDPFGNPVRCTT